MNFMNAMNDLKNISPAFNSFKLIKELNRISNKEGQKQYWHSRRHYVSLVRKLG